MFSKRRNCKKKSSGIQYYLGVEESETTHIGVDFETLVNTLVSKSRVHLTKYGHLKV